MNGIRLNWHLAIYSARFSMKRILFYWFVTGVCCVFVTAAQEKQPLKLVATIPLPGLKDGDFDHFAPDIDGKRLFLTAEENDKLEVLDANANKRTRTIDDSKAPHSALF